MNATEARAKDDGRVDGRRRISPSSAAMEVVAQSSLEIAPIFEAFGTDDTEAIEVSSSNNEDSDDDGDADDDIVCIPRPR